MKRLQHAPGSDHALRWRLFACLLLVLLPWTSPAARAEKPVSAFFRETWTTRDGLPHNQVNAIA